MFRAFPIPDRIYLDHAATTPLRPEAKAAMEEGFRLWANPSSPHAEGRKAREALEDARTRVKAALGWEGEVIFTSGASEGATLAIYAGMARDPLTSRVEHESMFVFQGADDEFLPVERDGSIDASYLSNAERPEYLRSPEYPAPYLVGIQHVNSETGNRQDIGRYAQITREKGDLLLVDCAQSIGKFPLPDCDMAIIAAHKFGGPIGVGALLVKNFAMLEPQRGQERGYRRGTENLPGVLGMAAALEACTTPYIDPRILEPLDELADECRKLGGTWLSDRLSDPTPYIRAIAMPGISGSAQLMRFDMAGIAVSQGSACSSGTMKRSHVLEAMQLDPDIADRTIRVSFGWTTTRAEVERFCEVWLDMARRAA